MPPEFFGREIQVITSGEVKIPVSFHLADREYVISEIVREWQDHGFGNSVARRKNKWWQRHHRNYYLVKTTDGELFEIYYDRGIKLDHPELKKSVLHRRL